MTALLNLALPAALLLIALMTARRARNSRHKGSTWLKGALLAVLVSIVYATLQPSYLPKTSVPPLPPVPLDNKTTELHDRLRKPMPEEQRQEHFEQTFDVMERVRQINSPSGETGPATD